MTVKIKAVGFGATALANGNILHFDIAEADKPKKDRDMRKLEAEVERVDAKRIHELGWGTYADEAAIEDEDRAELGDEVHKLQEPPAVPEGKANSTPPPLDRDSAAAQVKRADAAAKPRAKRPAELRKAAEAAAAKAAEKRAAAAGGQGDPEAGPAG
jgi:hypothetical protein